MENKKSIEGFVKLSFNNEGDSKCACCPEGKHIYSGHVKWENHFDHINQQGDAEDLVQQFIFQNKPSLNGKRVKLTIEVID
jgi:hypothetical protein